MKGWDMTLPRESSQPLYNGIYVFDWATLAWAGKTAYTALSVNGSFKSWSHCDDTVARVWLPCSKMAVVKLKQGDKVWIGVFYRAANMHSIYTSFSGYLL
jgi:hypothetical protein